MLMDFACFPGRMAGQFSGMRDKANVVHARIRDIRGWVLEDWQKRTCSDEKRLSLVRKWLLMEYDAWMSASLKAPWEEI